jgi:hypothetical protein
MERLAELEFTAVEIDVHEDGGHLTPAQVAADPEAAIAACSDLQRLRPVAISFSAPETPELYDRFTACCRLAKSLGIVTPPRDINRYTSKNDALYTLGILYSILSGN